MTHNKYTSYDDIPYPHLSYLHSHPDRLATLATLLGMAPAPVKHCRVLELGCAGGGNLIPMAYGLPESEFVGIDLSARQVAEGQAAIAALGLPNITLKPLNILEVNAGWGQFDYIITHGIYSWVPAAVQDKIMEICRQNLAPQGVAYISYNTYPGWRMLGLAREMMLFHTRHMTDPHERSVEARRLLKFIAEAVPTANSAYGGFLKKYAQSLTGESEGTNPKLDALFLHDELAEVNDPLYFHEFMARATSHGLQFLAEAEFGAMLASNLPDEVAETINRISNDLIDVEQYLDFLHNRTFRMTLLCHEEISLQRKLRPEQVTAFYLASRAAPVSEQPDIHSNSVEKFRGPDEATLSTDHPVSKAALLRLTEIWPQSMLFDDLLTAAYERLGREADETGADAQVLGSTVLTAYGYSENLMELHLHAPNFVQEVSERPVASPVARWQVKSGLRVTNLRHERVNLDPFEGFLLHRLDGCHDRAALLEALLAGPVAKGDLVLNLDGAPVTDKTQFQTMLAEELEVKLHWLAHVALLTA